MRLEIEDERGLLSSEDLALLQRCADAAARTEGVTVPVSVFVEIVGDAQIREINREQRGLDRATDVLSFPTVNYPSGRTAGSCEARLLREYDPEENRCFAVTHNLSSFSLSSRNALNTGTIDLCKIRRVIQCKGKDNRRKSIGRCDLDAKHVIRCEIHHDQLQHKRRSAHKRYIRAR